MSTKGTFSFGTDADPLFCLDMANNHQGSVEHGKAIIEGVAEVAERTGARVMIKLQFRDLESLLHPADRLPHLEAEEGVSHYKKRFSETALTKGQFAELVAHARKHGLPIYATPFDEPSVDLCIEFGFDVIKVASASARDWPLLRKIGQTDLPVIVSTGGLKLNEIDDVVDYYASAGNPLAVLHCVSAYPTQVEDLQLDVVAQMKQRYPKLAIGYSGHEDPDAYDIAGLAIAKGAVIIERHVGLPTKAIKLNKYSLTIEGAHAWIAAAQRAAKACANGQPRRPVDGEENALTALRRGMYARRTIPAGKTVTADDIFFAMPVLEGQFHSGKYYEVVDTFTPMRPIYVHMPIGLKEPTDLPKALVIASIESRVKEMLEEAQISLDDDVTAELSHQYGFERFFEIGAVIIDVVNRDYAKKILIQFPGQKHPSHRHHKKEETFQVLSGTMDLVLDGQRKQLGAGQKQLVERDKFHSFSTQTGVIFEEVSTTHIKGDSEYEDDSIPSDPVTRKTAITLSL